MPAPPSGPTPEGRLRSALPDAVDLLITSLHSSQSPGDRFRSALMLLKLAGTSKWGGRLAHRIGPTSAFDVLSDIAESRRARTTSAQDRKLEGPLQSEDLKDHLESLLQAADSPDSPDLPTPHSPS